MYKTRLSGGGAVALKVGPFKSFSNFGGFFFSNWHIYKNKQKTFPGVM